MEQLRQRLARMLREKMRTSLVVDTQTKVAAKAGVSQSTVQRLLSLEQAATVDLLEQLAHAFGVKKPEHLLLESDEVKLLSLWSHLSDDDRATVLGFIQMKAQTKAVHDSAAPLTFQSTVPVPQEMRAASSRAAARRPTEKRLDKAADDKTKPTRARRKA